LVTGPGAEARNSIGLVLVGGMVFGTLFTLFVVPSVYMLIAQEHRSRRRERRCPLAGAAQAPPRYLRRGRRPSSSGFGEAFASTGAERTWVLEHRSAAETKPKPEIGGRPGPLRFRRWLRPTSDRGLR